jgi:hypothetical protein
MDYKDIARKKHQEFLMKKEEELRIEREKEEEIIRQETMAINICLEINDNIDSIQINNNHDNILISLINIESIIHKNIAFIKEKGKLVTIQDSILELVNILNKLNENGNKDVTMIQNISNIMTQIFNLLEIHIDIESMDTSQDEQLAKELSNKN